jgi:hypothetical protein
VCAVPSALFQETLVPFATVVVNGKDMPVIVIVEPSPVAGWFTGLVLDLEHDHNARVNKPAVIAEKKILLSFIK